MTINDLIQRKNEYSIFSSTRYICAISNWFDASILLIPNLLLPGKGAVLLEACFKTFGKMQYVTHQNFTKYSNIRSHHESQFNFDLLPLPWSLFKSIELAPL